MALFEGLSLHDEYRGFICLRTGMRDFLILRLFWLGDSDVLRQGKV